MKSRAGSDNKVEPTAAPPIDLLPWPARWMCALIFCVTLLAYLPAIQGGFIWDDAGHVTRPDLQSLHGLGRIWFEVGATQQYYPFLHTAFWVEHLFWGDLPLGYHLINVLLHATAACLLGLTLRHLFDEERAPQVCAPTKVGQNAVGRGATLLRPPRQRCDGSAWLAALLFALHPVCVESVAWIAEQKNTLSTVLYLCAALAYLRFDEKRKGTPYALATGLFVLALLTKTVTATLPAALLVAFWWKRGRLSWRREVVPLAPWFALAGAAGWLTAWFERTRIGAEGADFALTLVQRGLLAGRVIWFYLGKLVWPADLSFIYPRWTVDPAQAWQWLFPLAALVLLAGLWLGRRRGAIAGLLFFVGTLFPALGFINVFPFMFSFVADHFQYLACTGILAMGSAGLVAVLTRFSPWVGRMLCLLMLTVLGTLTWAQARMYRDVFVLYQTTIDKNPACWMAYNNLAEALTNTGRAGEAIPLLERALKLRPGFPEAENNLGDDLRLVGRAPEAIRHLQKALQLRPNFAEAHNNLGAALMMTGQSAQGIFEFKEALRLKAGYPMARFNLGLALANNGQTAEAIGDFAAAVRLKPDFGQAELNWGIGLALAGRFPEARIHFERALQLEPDSPGAHYSFGRALAGVRRLDEAISHYERALFLAPDFADAHLNLALALRQAGRLSEAEMHYQEATRLNAGGAPGPN
jgi:protein O-mannosyl-transferase